MGMNLGLGMRLGALGGASTPVIPLWTKFDGTGGNEVSTPYRAAHVPAGDFEVVVRVSQDNWDDNNTIFQGFASNFTGGGGWLFRRQTGTGRQIAFIARVGAVTRNFTVTYPSGWGAKTVWLRVLFDADNGSSQVEATFYYAEDDSNDEPSSWTLIGSDAYSPAGTLDAPSTELKVGADDSTSRSHMGKNHRMIYRIGGTIVADYHPTRDAEDLDTTFISPTETWTVEGGTTVVDT